MIVPDVPDSRRGEGRQLEIGERVAVAHPQDLLKKEDHRPGPVGAAAAVQIDRVDLGTGQRLEDIAHDGAPLRGKGPRIPPRHEVQPLDIVPQGADVLFRVPRLTGAPQVEIGLDAELFDKERFAAVGQFVVVVELAAAEDHSRLDPFVPGGRPIAGVANIDDPLAQVDPARQNRRRGEMPHRRDTPARADAPKVVGPDIEVIHPAAVFGRRDGDRVGELIRGVNFNSEGGRLGRLGVAVFQAPRQLDRQRAVGALAMIAQFPDVVVAPKAPLPGGEVPALGRRGQRYQRAVVRGGQRDLGGTQGSEKAQDEEQHRGKDRRSTAHGEPRGTAILGVNGLRRGILTVRQ